MQPRFLLVGTVQFKPTVKTSQQNRNYCEVKVEASWQVNYNNQTMNIISPYSIIFYGPKAQVASELNPGDLISADCLLSSQKKSGNNGIEFINYSLTGQGFSILNGSKTQSPAVDRSSHSASNNNNSFSDDIPF